MTIQSVSHSVTVDNITTARYIDTWVNIQKRRENVTYKTSSAPENVNLSFVQSEDIVSTNNLSIRDRSVSLPENRIITRGLDQVLESISSFSIESEQFLVTDQFAQVANVELKIPLFLQHVLSYTLRPNEIFADVKVLDNEFKTITQQDILVEKDNGSFTGYIYNNPIN